MDQCRNCRPRQFAGAIILSAGKQNAAKDVRALKRKPLFIACGDKDSYIVSTREVADYFRGLGAEVTYQEWPGLGHRMGDNIELGKWLHKQRSNAPAQSTPSRPRPVPATHTARTLLPEGLAMLNKSLLAALVSLSDDKALRPTPLRLSKTRAKVWLAEAAKDGKLTFQLVGGARRADFNFEELANGDRATLSLLVAELKSSDNDAHAMAGVYMESMGRFAAADQYFKKAGDASINRMSKLFE
jgi:hypothetical protein